MKLNPLIMMQKEFDDTGVILDPENNKALSLNVAGVIIWEALEKNCSVPEITDAIVQKFDVDPETAEKDVLAFLNVLKAKGMLSEE